MCIVINLDVVCLVCLNHSQQMHGIFEPDTETPDLKIAYKISKLSKLELNANNESLPDKICDNCLTDLRIAWRFHKNCETAAVVFQSILKPKLQEQNKKDEGTAESLGSNENNRKTTTKPSEQFPKRQIKPTKTETVLDDDDDDDDDNEYILSVPMDDTIDLEEGQELADNNATTEQTTTHKDLSAEFMDTTHGIIEIDYMSTASDTVVKEEDEGDIEEVYYISEEDLEEELPKKPCSSKSMRRLEIEMANTSKNSMLKFNVQNKITRGHPVSKTKQSSIIQKAKRSSTSRHRLDNEKKSKTLTKRKPVSHESKAPKICEICGNSYRYQHALNSHMRRHYNYKPFPCEMCRKGFVSNVELRRHMRVHTGSKPYACSFCNRRFSDFGSRVKHERTHTGERPYSCVTCGKTFAYAHVLTVHLRTHTGEKRFQCKLCPKGFTKKAYLLKHMSHFHSDHDDKGQGQTTTELSMDGTISEAGEETELKDTLKTQNFDDCIYTTEYVVEGADAESQMDNEDSKAADELIDEEEDDKTMLIHDQQIIQYAREEDEEYDNSEEEQIVEVKIYED